jgi:hypothetical protein
MKYAAARCACKYSSMSLLKRGGVLVYDLRPTVMASYASVRGLKVLVYEALSC